MAQVYSNSFFHYTREFETLVKILESGFMGSYANEQIPQKDGKIGHVYIPMISFCDIPLSQIRHIVTYGEFAIGMSRTWGNSLPLCPVCYFPKNKEANLTSCISSCYEAYENDRKSKRHKITVQTAKKILGYAKPTEKYREDDYAKNKRLDNYVEREWRKIYLANWFDSRKEYDDYGNSHGNHLFKKLRAMFKCSDINMIVVPDEESRKNLADRIKSLEKIGGNPVCANDALYLVSKITTIEEIDENY